MMARVNDICNLGESQSGLWSRTEAQSATMMRLSLSLLLYLHHLHDGETGLHELRVEVATSSSRESGLASSGRSERKKSMKKPDPRHTYLWPLSFSCCH